MCLAQLSTGIESVNLYKKGIDLMLIQYNKEQQENPNKNNKIQIKALFEKILIFSE